MWMRCEAVKSSGSWNTQLVQLFHYLLDHLGLGDGLFRAFVVIEIFGVHDDVNIGDVPRVRAAPWA